MNDARTILNGLCSEQELQTLVLDLASRCSWLSHHQLVPYRRSRDGQVRAIVEPGTTPGFPDLVLVRGRHTLWIELKTEHGKLSPKQMLWRDALLAAGQDWRCWRPSQWDEIEKTLKGVTLTIEEET